VSAPLNLARHPFRNERLPTLLVGLGTLALVLATLQQSVVAWQLLPGHARDVEAEVEKLEAESARLRAESSGLRDLAAPPDALREWAAVKTLVDRRTFSWTGLFAALEQALPAGVRLVSVQPAGGPSGTELSLNAVGRSSEDALALLQSLQAHGDFEAAFLNGWTEGRQGVDISCSVRYQPLSGGPR
jgi:Tfp pilus assembly protein PilN